MYELAGYFLNTLSVKYFICQVVAIMLFLLYGLFVVYIIRADKMQKIDILIAYPLSLIMYALCGYFILSIGVTYNRTTILSGMFFLAIAITLIFRNNIKICQSHFINNIKNVALLCGGALIFALFSTSGIIPVSVTNDSMYFFSEYPRAIVNYGKLVPAFDHFLTDASQGIAILGTLPFLFGFDEIFGIQTFLNVDFVALFTYAIYEIAGEILEDKYLKIRRSVSILACMMLITSMPFVLLSGWLMANLFFMEYMFVVLYLAYIYSKDGNLEDVCNNMTILSLFITGLSIMRMEGALTAGILILCILMLEYKGRNVALYLIPPMFILQSLYLYRIFVAMTLHPSFQFMTKGKALILLSFLIGIFIFSLFIRDRLPYIIKKYYPFILISGTLFLNLCVIFVDTSRYFTNIKAFTLNIFGNSGWGLLAPFIVAIFILIPKKSIKINYFDVTVICYILVTIVTAWARGDDLGYSFGDSGNRVLMHVVPTLVFAVIIKITEGIKYWQENN